MNTEARASLNQLDAYCVGSKGEAQQFIGFKHINGPHKWDSFAKGVFVTDWYLRVREDGVTIRDIARKLGDRHDTLRRLVNGILVLRQASNRDIFTLEQRYPGRPFAFSHLYTALTRPGYRNFLGLSSTWRQEEPAQDPVPNENLAQLSEVLRWLYGSRDDDQPPVVTSQNPHVKQLGEVVEHELALQVLRESGNLRTAYLEVDTPLRRFSDNLTKALRFSEEANKYVYDFEPEDEALLQVARRLSKVTSTLLRTMEAAATDLADVADR